MPTSELPDSMAVGDFNDDGHLDLGMVGSYYGVTGSRPCPVGQRRRWSGPFSTWLGGEIHYPAAVADFNGDGIDDLATANSNSGTVRVLLGNISGDLQPPVISTPAHRGPTGWRQVTSTATVTWTWWRRGRQCRRAAGRRFGGFSGPNSYATKCPPARLCWGISPMMATSMLP